MTYSSWGMVGYSPFVVIDVSFWFFYLPLVLFVCLLSFVCLFVFCTAQLVEPWFSCQRLGLSLWGESVESRMLDHQRIPSLREY